MAPHTVDFAYCRVTLTLPANYIRANLAVFHYTGTYYETLALSEAR